VTVISGKVGNIFELGFLLFLLQLKKDVPVTEAKTQALFYAILLLV